MHKPAATYSWWSREQRPFTLAEVVVDGAVHVLGLIVAIVAGSVLLAFALEPLVLAVERRVNNGPTIGGQVLVAMVVDRHGLWSLSRRHGRVVLTRR